MGVMVKIGSALRNELEKTALHKDTIRKVLKESGRLTAPMSTMVETGDINTIRRVIKDVQGFKRNDKLVADVFSQGQRDLAEFRQRASKIRG